MNAADMAQVFTSFDDHSSIFTFTDQDSGRLPLVDDIDWQKQQQRYTTGHLVSKIDDDRDDDIHCVNQSIHRRTSTLLPTMSLKKKEKKCALVTCFSITMWIHLNHGDAGLFQFLEYLVQWTDHLIMEPQPWKCYRAATRRLQRLGHPIPASKIQRLEIRGDDVVTKIDRYLSDHFQFRVNLGKTSWARQLILYSQTKLCDVCYDNE
jgi:hypothetical protein